MGIGEFFAIYFLGLALLVIVEIYLLSNDKTRYIYTSYKAIKSICDSLCVESSIVDSSLAKELNRFFNEFCQENPRLKKFCPNVVVWLDAIIFRVDAGNKKAAILKPYLVQLKVARDILEEEHPFNKCEVFQQNILRDIEKIKTTENEILVLNIVERTQSEFLRLSEDIKKNYRINIVSLTVGVFGVLVSAISLVITFYS